MPFFGIEPAILNPNTGEVCASNPFYLLLSFYFFQELKGNNVEGVLVLKHPWPSIARTIYQDHKRYLETYMQPYPGYFYTGDGAARDEDGYIWIKGRVDGGLGFPCCLLPHLLEHRTKDVINVSGHRLSTAEIESALILHAGVAETAVIGTADELTGQALYVFATLKP